MHFAIKCLDLQTAAAVQIKNLEGTKSLFKRLYFLDAASGVVTHTKKVKT
jgi:hypothetical protein